MEITLNNSFVDLSNETLSNIDAGGFWSDAWNETCKGLTVMASGALVGAKVGAATCTPVGVVAGVVVGGIVSVAWDKWMK